MLRLVLPLLVLTTFVASAQAQRRLPLSPGVMPGSSIGPGTQFLPQPVPRFIPSTGFGGGVGGGTAYVRPGVSPYRRSVGYGYGYGGYGGYGLYGSYYGYGSGYGYGYSYPYYSLYDYSGLGFYGAGYGSFPPVSTTNPGAAYLANEFPATLAVQLPAATKTWINGEELKGGSADAHLFTSPSIKQGETYTFHLKLRWEKDGKTYETTREVTLKPGERGRLMVLSGEEVKE